MNFETESKSKSKTVELRGMFSLLPSQCSLACFQLYSVALKVHSIRPWYKITSIQFIKQKLKTSRSNFRRNSNSENGSVLKSSESSFKEEYHII